jgi:hypothetical protein
VALFLDDAELYASWCEHERHDRVLQFGASLLALPGAVQTNLAARNPLKLWKRSKLSCMALALSKSHAFEHLSLKQVTLAAECSSLVA